MFRRKIKVVEANKGIYGKVFLVQLFKVNNTGFHMIQSVKKFNFREYAESYAKDLREELNKTYMVM